MNMHNSEQMRQHKEHLARKKRMSVIAPKAIPSAEMFVPREVAQLRAERDSLKERLVRASEQLEACERRFDEAQAMILRQIEVLSEKSEKRSIRSIAADVLVDFPGITWDDLKGSGRSRKYTIPRQICMAAIYEERPDLSLPQVGRAMGGKDHTSILAAVRKIKAIMEGADL